MSNPWTNACANGLPHSSSFDSSSEDEQQSCSLYINEAGICSDVPPRVSATTLYRSGSLSIVNCEYKLKEKFPHLIYLIFFFIIYILLILLGTSLFVLFEAKAELRVRDVILNRQQMFLDQNQCVDPQQLRQFVEKVIETYDKGVNLALLNNLLNSQSEQKPNENAAEIDNQPVASYVTADRHELETSNQLAEKDPKEIQIQNQINVPVHMANWEFSSSLTYVASVVTTIGYGHVTPITNEGKLLTIVFGAIAIPCTLLFLSVLISMIRDGPIKLIEIWLIKLFTRFTQITLLKIRFLHLILVTLLLFTLLLLLPAFAFQQMEAEWTLLDCFYYCFVTITTIGLGDYVPGQNGIEIDNRAFYLIGIVLYMYIGLCMIMLWIALVLRIPYFNFKTFLVIEEPEILEQKNEESQPLLAERRNITTYQAM